MSETIIGISIRGLDEVLFVARELPELPMQALLPTVQELRDLGVEAARRLLVETATSVFSTGETARLMTGIIQSRSDIQGYVVMIGPDTSHYPEPHRSYPKFLETGSAAGATINRRVQLLPVPVRMSYMPTGTWAFIGDRTQVQARPWMTAIKESILRETAKIYGKKIYEGVGKIKRNKKTGEIIGPIKVDIEMIR